MLRWNEITLGVRMIVLAAGLAARAFPFLFGSAFEIAAKTEGWQRLFLEVPPIGSSGLAARADNVSSYEFSCFTRVLTAVLSLIRHMR
jgi:hypothetical protein